MSQAAAGQAARRLVAPPDGQILVFTYHKSGTVLFHNVMRRFARICGASYRILFGQVTELDEAPGIIVLAHSLIGCSLARNVRGVRCIRDPRDIWVSGYLYHQRCNEGWCTNADTGLGPPITYPRVDYSMQHRPEAWKRDYLERLGGKSYQQNLRERNEADGLAFELDGYTAATMEAMRDWRPLPQVMDIRLETIVADFDTTFRRVFDHLGLDAAQCAAALKCAAAEDVSRMDDASLAARRHISGRELSKWRRVLSPAQVAGFESRYGDVIDALGYERAA